MVDTSDDWIVRRTGIRERRIVAENQFASDLAIRAVKDLYARYAVSLDDVDLVIVSTSTPDYGFPSVAARVQAQFNMKMAGAFDLNATCAGFEYILHVANGLITSGLNRKVLVIAAETMSRVTDYSDRSTCVLLGDGAGAALLEWEESGNFFGSIMGSDGSRGKLLYRTGLSQMMDGEKLVGAGKMVQNGPELYKWVVKNVTRSIKQLLTQSGCAAANIDWFVPHSANLRMIEAISERLDFPIEKVLVSLEFYGNTSSATVPLALSDALKHGKIKSGDTLLLYGFGGGVVHCGQLIRWSPLEERTNETAAQ